MSQKTVRDIVNWRFIDGQSTLSFDGMSEFHTILKHGSLVGSGGYGYWKRKNVPMESVASTAVNAPVATEESSTRLGS